MSDLNVHTTAEINALTPITGDLVIDSDLNAVKLYDGAAWKSFSNDAPLPFGNQWAASFDKNSSNRLEAPVSTGLWSSDFTLSIWFNKDSTSMQVLAEGNGSATGYSDGWRMYVTSKPTIWTGGSTGGATANLLTTNSSISTNNTWHHVAFSQSGNTIALYLDGSLENSTTHSRNWAVDTLRFGGDAVIGGFGMFNGLIDDAAVFDTALSAADITKIYNGTAPNGKPNSLTEASSYDTDRTSNLKGYWRMGDDSNDSPSSDPSSNSIATITDSSGNGNDATQGTASSQPTFSDLTGESIYV